MIGQFILMDGIFLGGGLAFFDGAASIWYERMVIYLMAAASYQPPVPQTIERRLSSPKTAVRFGIM